MKRNRLISLWLVLLLSVKALCPSLVYAKEEVCDFPLVEDMPVENEGEKTDSTIVEDFDYPLDGDVDISEGENGEDGEDVEDEVLFGDFGIDLAAYNPGLEFSSGDHLFTGYIRNRDGSHMHARYFGSATGIYYNCDMTGNDFYALSYLNGSNVNVYVYSGDYVCNRKPYTSGGEGVFYVASGNITLGAMPERFEYLLRNDGKVEGVDYRKDKGLCINLNNSSLKIHGTGYHELSDYGHAEYSKFDDQPYAAVTVCAEGPVTVSMYAGQIYWCSSSAINLAFDGGSGENSFYGYGGEIYESSNYSVSSSGYCKYMEFSGMDIHDNYNGIQCHSRGYIYISEGNRIHDIVNISVENRGNMVIDGGEIYNNSYGVVNFGTLTQKQDITGNYLYDIQARSGVYENYNVKADVYLANNQYIHAMKTITEPIGEVTVAPGNEALGRIILQVESEPNEGEAAAVARNIVNQDFLVIEKKDGLSTIRFDIATMNGNYERRDGLLVAGNGYSGATNQVVLSAPIKVNFTSDMDAKLPEEVAGRWAEAITLPEQVPTYYIDGKDVSGSFIFENWKSKLSENPIHPGDTLSEDFMKRTMASDVVLSDEKSIDFALVYDGNGQTKGENKRVEHCNLSTPFEDNWFEKEESVKDVDKPLTYKHLGWWYDKTATYKDIDLGNPIDMQQFFEKSLEVKNYSIDEGVLSLTAFSIWDRQPYIVIPEIYVDQDKLEAMTKEELNNKIADNVVVSDLEDEDLVARVEELEIDRLLSDTLIGGSISVRAEASDGVGNTASTLGYVHIVPSGRLYDVKGTRFIDEENYKKSSSADGALEANSLWYLDEDYKSVLLNAFGKVGNR